MHFEIWYNMNVLRSCHTKLQLQKYGSMILADILVVRIWCYCKMAKSNIYIILVVQSYFFLERRLPNKASITVYTSFLRENSQFGWWWFSAQGRGGRKFCSQQLSWGIVIRQGSNSGGHSCGTALLVHLGSSVESLLLQSSQ